jgi:hypothetical protein
MWLSTKLFSGNRAAFEKLSFELMDEARAVEKEFDFSGTQIRHAASSFEKSGT